MKIVAILIGISLFLALIFLAGFYYALKSGQFEDLESPSFRLLNDDNNIKSKRHLKNAKRNI